MRVLIAAGGTGGHIYPALAVARSRRVRPDGPTVHWLGGRRGLEATLVPAAGLPLTVTRRPGLVIYELGSSNASSGPSADSRAVGKSGSD